MAQLSIIKKSSDSKILENASYAINLQIQAVEIKEELDTLKSWFRDKANGEKLDITVAGEGKIQVKTPAEPTSGTSIVLNEVAFEGLSAVTKRELVRLGVVSYNHWESNGSIAAVVITPNK